jgi:protein-S-isoprenylcysteine O-methyltransferase Ste14
MKTAFAFKVIAYSLLIPGFVLGVVPYFILRQSGHIELPEASVQTVFASILLLISSGFLGYCIYEFASHGQGTLSPIDPPKSLVVKGSYRYTRNPMYIAVSCILMSEVMLFCTKGILIYFFLSILVIHLFVLLYEEPHLLKQFGKEYENYCRAVPRWWIARQPYTGKIRNT